jgi:hypothetical protein
MFGSCSFCFAVRPGRLAPVPHTAECPAGSHRAAFLDHDESVFFHHPDLVELDLTTAAWWPAA